MDAIYDAAERENRAVTTAEQRRLLDLQKRHADAEVELTGYMADLESKSRGIAAESMREIRAAKIKAASNDTTLGKLARHLIRGGVLPGGLESRVLSNTSGAATIQDPNVLNNIIYALQSNDPLTAAGAEFIVMDNYSQYPKVTGYPAVQWWTEGDTVNDANVTIAPIQWSFKDITVRVDVYDNVLYDSSGRAERAVTEACRRSIQNGLLLAVLAGDSGSDQPDGLDNYSGVLTVDAESNPLNYFHLLDGYRKILDANGNPDNVTMMGNPVAWRQLAGLVGSDNQPLMQPEGITAMRKFWTTAVGKTYGAGNDLTRVYMGDFSQLIVGFQGGFEFRLDQVAKTALKTVFLMHLRCDVQLLHPDNFVIIENVATTVPVQGN